MDGIIWLNDVWTCSDYEPVELKICEDILKTCLKSFIGSLNFHISQDKLILFMESIKMTIQSIAKLGE